MRFFPSRVKILIMIRCCAVVLLLLFLSVSCAKTSTPEAPPPAADAPVPVSVPANLFAILKTGESPLWFELADEGPRQISGPEEAALSPFTPWPLTRHIRGVLTRGTELAAGVNRDGLLLLRPWDGADDGAGGIALYRIADVPFWENYTLGNLFFYGEKTAALLYRDDFFTDPAAPAPSPPVWALKDDLSGFEGLELPALGDIPFADGWEADALRPGGNGLWYYRGIHREGGGQAVRYYRTADLGQAGEEISVGVYRDSERTEQDAADEEVWIQSFPLPPLPDNFVYTGVAFVGDTVFAAWEEQQDWNIGAAGFMVIDMNRLGR
ncbi:hypothetical protein FACS1894109_09600 [Spirochaetia bacterium]|nr:hypothetical protein FACS1894109_09600 [Spirochaetia bacterium]